MRLARNWQGLSLRRRGAEDAEEEGEEGGRRVEDWQGLSLRRGGAEDAEEEGEGFWAFNRDRLRF